MANSGVSQPTRLTLGRMRLFVVGLVLAGLWGLGSVAGAPAPVASTAEPAGLVSALRYIGRDPVTGMPERVGDRFVSEQERAIERYGKDEREAIPPPPVHGADVSRLGLAGLGIEAKVARYGVDRFGRLDVPHDGVTVGWQPGYSDLPGAGGATFFAAHYEYLGVPGVFFRLSTLGAGETVVIVLSDGASARYRVTSTVEYALGAIDMGAILKGREGVESITLMTCSGPANEGEYAFRTVVLAERVGR